MPFCRVRDRKGVNQVGGIMEVGPNSDLRIVPRSGKDFGPPEPNGLQRQYAEYQGSQSGNWQPGRDPGWMQAMRASLQQPLQMDANGAYNVQFGDCLRSIAERIIHMSGQRSTRQGVDQVSAQLIELNKQAYPELAANPDIVSSRFAQGNQPGWQLRLPVNQPLPDQAGPVAGPPIGNDGIAQPSYPYPHHHRRDHYPYGVAPGSEYYTQSHGVPGYGQGFGSPNPGQAITGLLGLVGGASRPRYGYGCQTMVAFLVVSTTITTPTTMLITVQSRTTRVRTTTQSHTTIRLHTTIPRRSTTSMVVAAAGGIGTTTIAESRPPAPSSLKSLMILYLVATWPLQIGTRKDRHN